LALYTRSRTNLFISPADELTPRHNNRVIPARATESKNRVLVRKTHIARVGGKFALAIFQLTPPFGSSIAVLAPNQGVFAFRKRMLLIRKNEKGKKKMNERSTPD
jgi:hypothetical protein